MDQIPDILNNDCNASIKDSPDLNNNDDGNVETLDTTSSESESEHENNYLEEEASSDDEIEIVEDLGLTRAPLQKQPVIDFEQLKVGDAVFAPEASKGIERPWHPAIVNEIRERYGRFVVSVTFSIELIKGGARILKQMNANLSFKHVAYFDEKPKMCKIIPKGLRVVALTQFTKSLGDRFYSGIIAEIPTGMNNNRYLVIFDSGAVKYISKENVRMICLYESNAWSDMSLKVQVFVKNFLNKSPDYPLARRNRLHSIIQIEWNGLWWSARVVKVDCSLIQVELTENSLKFWIYRGSSRILENNKKAQREIKQYKLQVELGLQPKPLIYNEEFEGKVEKHQVPKKYLNRWELRDTFHVCSTKTCSPVTRPECVNLPKNLSPLVLPLYFGWDRKIENNEKQDIVYYKTPCGRKVYDLKGIREFLNVTKSSLGIDSFCFDVAVDCLAEFKPRVEPYINDEDISHGLEKVSVQMINSVDKIPAPLFCYITHNIEDDSVKARREIGNNFILGCDCLDGCLDKKNCSCCKLTHDTEPGIVDGVARFGEGSVGFGYEDKRLFHEYVSGVYECNPNCKCSASCENRVVQKGLQYRLQVFKTSSKGYGVRTLQDIPYGAFVCVYAGELMSEEAAFNAGMQDGDTYLLNLDMIENCVSIYGRKPGFEPFAIEPKDDQMKKEKSKKKHQNGRSSDEKDDIDDENQNEITERMKMFGQDEAVFVVDSMRMGNIGRFLSHACDPNVWPQNVFVDTHDLRFPVVAFFANRAIKCGSELTWNYNYQVGSVEGKEMACNCGSVTCKKRLL